MSRTVKYRENLQSHNTLTNYEKEYVTDYTLGYVTNCFVNILGNTISCRFGRRVKTNNLC